MVMAIWTSPISKNCRYGSWSKDQNDFRRNRARVYVLKTLNCDKESYLAIGMLVNLICYYANEFISKHMDHFD